jgi:hypothetical protein
VLQARYGTLGRAGADEGRTSSAGSTHASTVAAISQTTATVGGTPACAATSETLG